MAKRPSPDKLAEAATAALNSHNADSERSVLGAMLLDNGIVDQVWIELDRLGKDWPAAFFDARNRGIAMEMRRLWDSGLPIEMVLLVDALRRRGRLDDCGGFVYIASLEQGVLTTGATPDVARRLAMMALHRKTATQMLQFMEAMVGFDEEGFLSACSRAILTIGDVRNAMTDYRPADGNDLANSIMDLLDAKRDRKVVLKNPFDGFNGAIPVLIGGDFVLLAGFSSTGKTGMAWEMIECWAQQIACCPKDENGRFRVVCMFSGEEDKASVAATQIQRRTGVSLRKMATGGMNESDTVLVREVLEELRRFPVVADDLQQSAGNKRRAITPDYVESQLYLLEARGIKVDAVFIDNSEKMEPDSGGSFRDAMNLPERFRSIANRYNAVMVVLGQMDPGQLGRDYKPGQIIPIRGNKSFYLSADFALYLNNHGYVKPDAYKGMASVPIDLHVVKTRGSDPVGVVPLTLEKKYRKFLPRREDAPAPATNGKESRNGGDWQSRY